MTAEVAPAAMHDLLDTYYPLMGMAKRMGMAATIIMTVDAHGNLGPPKVTTTADVAKSKGPRVD